MPIEIRTNTTQPNSTLTFTFTNTIRQYMVGILNFKLSFGNTDHHVQKMSIALNVNQSGKNLQVVPSATLVDKNGHNMSTADSSVTVVAMVWSDVNDDNLKLGNVFNIANNTSSSQIAIPCTNPCVLQAALAGFDLEYGSTDHHMETVDCGVGTMVSGGYATITGQAQMYDDTGHTASTATVNGGLIANCDTTLPLQVMLTNNLQNTSQKFTLDNGIHNFQPFLSAFKAQFKNNSDHHLKNISINLTAQSTSPNTVNVSGGAYLNDDSGNSQDDGISHVVGFVVGY